MSSHLLTLAPSIVGPGAMLVFSLLVIISILVIARLVFALAWRVLLLAGIALGLFWLIGAVTVGPPGRMPVGTAVMHSVGPPGVGIEVFQEWTVTEPLNTISQMIKPFGL